MHAPQWWPSNSRGQLLRWLWLKIEELGLRRFYSFPSTKEAKCVLHVAGPSGRARRWLRQLRSEKERLSTVLLEVERDQQTALAEAERPG